MAFPITFNPTLAALPVYQPGRPITEVARELGIPASDIIKLASNENPLGPSPLALAAVREMLPQSHLYPDGNAFHLKQKLADHLGVTPAHLILGNGSNEIIEFVGHSVLAPGVDVVVSQYCFAIYPIIARMAGANVVTVPARAHGHDLRAMLRAITPATRVVFVANPNNPTGTVAPREEVVELINGVPDHVLLVMDEAYIEFLDDAVDLLPLIRANVRPNLVLMRTFSKIYGLAGFRVGYGIGHPEIIKTWEKVRQPFNINSLAQAAALAALADREHLQKTRHNNREGLRLYAQAFHELDLPYVPTPTNFILVKVGDGARVVAELQQRGVIVRPMGGYQLPEFIRMSIGTPAENQRCLAALRAVLGVIKSG